jgi:hypothetical protein
MPDRVVINYDLDAPESVAARAAVRAPLLIVAAARERGTVQPRDSELFNLELNELLLEAQNDPELTVRFLMELVMAVDHGAHALAMASGLPHPAVVYHLLPGDREDTPRP